MLERIVKSLLWLLYSCQALWINHQNTTIATHLNAFLFRYLVCFNVGPYNCSGIDGNYEFHFLVFVMVERKKKSISCLMRKRAEAILAVDYNINHNMLQWPFMIGGIVYLSVRIIHSVAIVGEDRCFISYENFCVKIWFNENMN